LYLSVYFGRPKIGANLYIPATK